MRHPDRLAALCFCVLASCATAKLDTKRPITVDSGFLADSYKQDGQTLEGGDLVDKLSAHPAAGPVMSGYQTKRWMAFGLFLIGDGLVIYDLAANHLGDSLSKSNNSYTLTFVGLGIMVASLPLGFMAQHQLHEAVDAYNASFPKSQGGLPSYWPVLAVSTDRHGGHQYTFGAGARF
jgi:hypothetical protein